MSDIEEGSTILHNEMTGVFNGDKEADVVHSPTSDNSMKTKKKKKSKRNSSESSTKFEIEGDVVKKKKKMKTSSTKKKKKREKVDSSTPKTSPSSSVNKSSDGSKRKKKKVSKIDMAGDVTGIDSDTEDIPSMQAPYLGSGSSLDEEMGHPKKKKKRSKRDLNGKKKKKKSKEASNEIEPSSTKKGKKKIPQIDDNGDVVSFYPSRMTQQKKKRRGKRPSESTLKTYDYDEENQRVRLSSRGKRISESTQKTFDYDKEDPHLRFSSSTLGSTSIVEIYDSKSSPVRTRREYDGEYTDDDEDDEDDHNVFADDDEDSYTDDQDDVYMREIGYNEPDDGSFYNDYLYDVNGLDDERVSFKRATFDLADTGIRDTKCCLIFAGIFFICTTVGTSMLLTRLTKRDE